jgi:hypothetical protein
MALPAAVVPFITPTSITSQNVTKSGFGTPVGALLFGNGRNNSNADGKSTIGGANNDMPWWFALTDFTNTASVRNQDNFSSGDGDIDSARITFVVGSLGTLQSNSIAAITDGITINWGSVYTGAGWDYWVVLFGGDITNAKLISANEPGSAGNVAFTGAGFQPDAVILIGGSATHGNGIGFMDKLGNQFCWSSNYGGSIGRIARADRAFTNYIGGVEHGSATFVSMDSGGFTLNFASGASGFTDSIFGLCLKGASFQVGTGSAGTSTGNKQQATNFQPNVVLLGSADKIAGTTADTAYLGTGVAAMDATTQGAIGVTDNAHGNAYRWTDGHVLWGDNDSSSAILQTAKFVSMDTTPGFTLNWDVTDAVARQFGFMAIGAGGAGPPPTVAPAFQPHRMPIGC